MHNQDEISPEQTKSLLGGRRDSIEAPSGGLGAGRGQFSELRSEEVQEMLSNAPPWAVRWGNTVFLMILLGVLGLGFVVRYPEVVTAPFVLTSNDVPKPVVAKTNGRLIKLWVKDNQQVRQGQLLAFIESNASHTEVLALEKALDSLATLVNTGRFEAVATFRSHDFQHLGELQADYQAFMQQFGETSTLFANGYLGQKRDFIRYELTDLAQNHDQLLQQFEIQNKEFKMAEREFAMHKKLYEQKVISWAEYQKEERALLAKQLPLKQLEMSITNNMTAQTQKQRETAELNKQANDQKLSFVQSLNALRASVVAWKVRHTPVAPRTGQVFFASLWQEDQPLKTDEVLFYVGTRQSGYFGEARIAQANAGKVRVGQRVLVKFQSYPFEQFGMVEGQVKNIASIPSADSTFRVTVTLPNGLTTNSGKNLPFKNNLNASAEIVTDDVSVAERMFYQLRNLLNR
jgi:HlyD family secretion protein